MVLVILCQRGTSLLETARLFGLEPPQYRIGVVPNQPPRPNEVLVAKIVAIRHSLGLPVFRIEEDRKSQ